MFVVEGDFNAKHSSRNATLINSKIQKPQRYILGINKLLANGHLQNSRCNRFSCRQRFAIN